LFLDSKNSVDLGASKGNVLMICQTRWTVSSLQICQEVKF